jgi:hypothetical protein
MCAHANQSQNVFIGPLIDQQQVTFQVAFAMIFPVADESMVTMFIPGAADPAREG